VRLEDLDLFLALGEGGAVDGGTMGSTTGWLGGGGGDGGLGGRGRDGCPILFFFSIGQA